MAIISKTHSITLNGIATTSFLARNGFTKEIEKLLDLPWIKRAIERRVWSTVEQFAKDLYDHYSIEGNPMENWKKPNEVKESLRISIITGCLAKGFETAVNTGEIMYDFHKCILAQMTSENAEKFIEETLQEYKEYFVEKVARIRATNANGGQEPEEQEVEMMYLKMMEEIYTLGI